MARKNDGKAAKRAAKKHAKEVKRRRALAARGTTDTAPRFPYDRWRPAREGIEGLARRMGINAHAAAGLAEHLHRHHGRKDATAAWLPSRVRALDTGAIASALAERGVVTDEASFRALAAEHLSSRRLAEVAWLPSLPAGHDVHDRDFCGVAADRLWVEWSPDIQSDEQAKTGLDGVDVALDELEPEEALHRVLRVWEGFAPGGAPRRLERAGLLTRLVDLASDALDEGLADDGLEKESMIEIRAMLREIGDDVGLDGDTRYRLTDARDDLDWALGDSDEVLTRKLYAAASREDPIQVLDAAALVLSHHDASDAQLLRVRDALVAVMPTVRDDLRADVESFVSDIDEVRAIEAGR